MGRVGHELKDLAIMQGVLVSPRPHPPLSVITYLLLGGALGEHVAVADVVDLNVLDEPDARRRVSASREREEVEHVLGVVELASTGDVGRVGRRWLGVLSGNASGDFSCRGGDVRSAMGPKPKAPSSCKHFGWTCATLVSGPGWRRARRRPRRAPSSRTPPSANGPALACPATVTPASLHDSPAASRALFSSVVDGLTSPAGEPEPSVLTAFDEPSAGSSHLRFDPIVDDMSFR